MNTPNYSKFVFSKTVHNMKLLLLLLLLLLVFSPWDGLGRDKRSVMRLVWLWYAATCVGSQGQLAILSPAFQMFPLLTTRCLHVRQDVRVPSGEVGTVGEKVVRQFCRNNDFQAIQGSFTCRKSTTLDRRFYFPSEGRSAEDFFTLKNPTASAGFEPANLGTKDHHATSRPLKPLCTVYCIVSYCEVVFVNL